MTTAKSNDMLQSAPTEALRTRVKLIIADTLLVRARGNDRVEAVRVYKEVINDTALPPGIRAWAMSQLAFIFDFRGNSEFMKLNVFNEEPYATFLGESGTGIFGALRRIYEQSDALYPNAFAKLQIALKYSRLLPMTERGLTAVETAKLVRRYITEAKPLMDALPYDGDIRAYMHWARAASLYMVEKIEQGGDLQEVEAAYQQAMTTASSGSNLRSQSILIFTRLRYAMDLVDGFGEGRQDDVLELIRPIIAQNPGFRATDTYLRRMKVVPTDDFRRENILGIARMSPEFRSLLVKLGWDTAS